MCNGKFDRSVCSSLTFVISTLIAGLEPSGPLLCAATIVNLRLSLKCPEKGVNATTLGQRAEDCTAWPGIDDYNVHNIDPRGSFRAPARTVSTENCAACLQKAVRQFPNHDLRPVTFELQRLAAVGHRDVITLSRDHRA